MFDSRPASASGPGAIDALLTELDDARRGFLAALDDVEPALLTAPGLVGEWSARELVAHIGYWCGHATEALHHAEQGRLTEFHEEGLDVDARNETVARVARETDFATVRQREEGSYAALVDRLSELDPALLSEPVPFGGTLHDVVREDGAEHYREHTRDLRSWWTEGAARDEEPVEVDDEDDEDEDVLDDALDPGTDDDDADER